MRLFTGLDVPYEMRRNLELLLELLRPTAQIQWSPLDNLHITTLFIGEWPEEGLDELKQALARIPVPGELAIGIRGLGWFPNPHSPRVFFAAIASPDGLHALASDTEAALSGLGLAAAKRSFQPHLTLARIKPPAALLELKQTIAGLPSVDFGAYTAKQFHLYLSQQRNGRSVYTKLASYPLMAQATQ